MSALQYRPEIDGLRAFAVLPVVFFHAGFEVFRGGFVGVDVFFVISGYLITSIILLQRMAGTFSLVRFYENRVRRILPALFLVMFASVPFAWFWLLPDDLRQFSQSVAAVAVFASNILFWRQSGYFDTASELKPLLHTWSLAVEEQYYLLFPLFVLALWRFGRRWIAGSLLIIAVLSLAAAHWGAYHKPIATFYLLPTRGWELLAGALVAFYSNAYASQHALLANLRVCQLGSVLGLAMIAVAVLVFDKSTPFPSLYAVVPVIGTVLVILFAHPTTVAGRVLGSKILVGIGLMSYSIYLWHQPLFAFARHRSLTEPGSAVLWGLSAAALGLAYLTWRYVESPFRQKGRIDKRTVAWGAALASVVGMTLGGVMTHVDNLSNPYAVSAQLEGTFARTLRTQECFDKAKVHERQDWTCVLGIPSGKTAFLVAGDSHALSLLDTLDDIAAGHQLKGEFVGVSACIPFLGVHALNHEQDERNCHALNERIFDYVSRTGIKRLLLVARWTYYTDGDYNGQNVAYIGVSSTSRSDKRSSREAFEIGLKKTIEAYKGIGVELIVVKQVPQQLYEPKRVYYEAMKAADTKQALRQWSLDTDVHHRLQIYVNSLFSRYDSVSWVSPEAVFCDSEKCTIGTGDASFYYDKNHLSIAGARQLGAVLAGQITKS